MNKRNKQTSEKYLEEMDLFSKEWSEKLSGVIAAAKTQRMRGH